jgi:uncharacterized protein YodC (DUF2158 family)
MFPLLAGPTGTLSAQTAGTYVCTARDDSRQAGFVSQLFNVSQADAARVTPAWSAAITRYGVTPSTAPACQGFAKFTAADSARKQFIAFVTNSLEQRVDQMPWTYGSAPQATGDAPSAVASPVPAGGSNAPATGTQQAARAEMSQAKGYCMQNHAGMYDCDGYAQAVYQHRLAHPDEMVTGKGGQTRIVTLNALETGARYHLDCTSCLNDQMLTAWAREHVRHGFSAAVLSHTLTQNGVDTYADCVAKAFVPMMHARPNVDDYPRNLNDASAGCGQPH